MPADVSLAPRAAAPAPRRAEARRDRAIARRPRRRDERARRSATGRSLELVYSAGLRSAEAVGLDLGDVDFEQEHVHVRHGKGAKDRVVPLGEEAAHLGRPLPARGAAPARARRRERAVPLGPRPAARHLDAAPPRPAPTPSAPRVRDPSARRRRRPAHDPGAPRPRVALDDADLQPRRRQAPAPGLRPCPSAILTSRASWRCSPRAGPPSTVEAYRRDLHAARHRTRPAALARRASTTSSDTWHSSAPTASPSDARAPHGGGARLLPAPAADRARERQPRRRALAAAPRAEASADAVGRRGGAPDRPPPRGTQPRDLRDRALVELLYGAGLRVSEAVGLEKSGVDLDDRRRAASSARAARSGSSRSDARPSRRFAATCRAAGRTSTAGTGRSCS